MLGVRAFVLIGLMGGVCAEHWRRQLGGAGVCGGLAGAGGTIWSVRTILETLARSRS
jgi:hypothetical protein